MLKMTLISEKHKKFIKSIKIGDINEANSNFVFVYFNEEDKYGLKPIHWACLSSNMEILEWMLNKNCNIETPTRNGWRPIHFASFIANEEMVQFLIKRSCKTDCKTDNGETISDVTNLDCNHEFINEILNENINWKIGISMGLKCGGDCDHKFCMRTLIRPEYYIDMIIERYQPRKVIPLTNSYSNRKFVMSIIEKHEYDEYENAKCIWPKINEILPNLIDSKITKYYGLIETETRMILFIEWFNKRSLMKEIKRNIKLNNAKLFQYCKDILQAIVFLHDNKILHRFIHPTNVFIDNNGGCKLILSNFSYSLADGDVQINDEWLNKNLNYSYAAPEVVINGILSYPYDIWMLGCTVIEMSTGIHRNYQTIKFDEIEKIISEIPNETLQSFIRRMVTKSGNERATAKDLLNHEFMRNGLIGNENI